MVEVMDALKLLRREDRETGDPNLDTLNEHRAQGQMTAADVYQWGEDLDDELPWTWSAGFIGDDDSEDEDSEGWGTGSARTKREAAILAADHVIGLLSARIADLAAEREGWLQFMAEQQAEPGDA